MINDRTFPWIQICTCVCASIVYAFKGDWSRTIYWFCAAALTGTTLFMK